MKCICGYEEKFYPALSDYDSPRPENTPFYKANMTVTINQKQGDWDHDRLSVHEVYVCPECGTLKINPEE